MSLKAKIEAVIYASEEPVTLAQLTGLLGVEAQAELDALVSRQQSLALEDQPAGDGGDAPGPDIAESDSGALNAEVLDSSSNAEAPVNQAEPGAHDEADTLEAVPAAVPLSAELSSQPQRAGVGSGVERPAVDEATEAAPVPDDRARAAALKLKERRLREYFRLLLDQLIADYATEDRGLEIREVAGGFRLATKPEYHDAVRGFVKSLKPPLKLSLQALETLAVVAYKQPVTSPEVSEIRGVDSAGVLGSLMARKLVTTAGRKPVIGRPILYKTTKDFLLRFGLKDINELPSIEEFEKMAGELNAAVQEEISMDTPHISSPEDDQARYEEEGGARGSSSSETSAHAAAHIPVLDERNSPTRPRTQHDTTDDLMSDKSTALQGRSREQMDTHLVQPESQQGATESQHRPEAQSQPEAQLRAEDGDEREDVADEAVVDGRISGPPPSYGDDSPSAEEAREQEEQQDEEHREP